VKTRQYSAKILEITLEDEENFIQFFEKNYRFFQNHLIVINGEENQKIQDYMKSKNLTAVFNLSLPAHNVEKQKRELQSSPSTQKKNSLKVLDKLVRSGQEIRVDGDLLLLNRVNSGGSIVINGSLIVTQKVDGSIRCEGDFMLLKASSKANIVFHGVEVDNKFLQNKLNRVELVDDEIRITPALKETNWV
jgi:septum formation inhibitor MinC